MLNYPPGSYATSYTPVLEHHEESSSDGMIIVGGLVLLIIAVVIALSRQQSNAPHTLDPHYVRVTPPQTAIASALGPLQTGFFAPGPQLISPDANCVPGSFYYPVCLSQTPIQSFTSGTNNTCVRNSPYWPLCLQTAARPLAGMRN